MAVFHAAAPMVAAASGDTLVEGGSAVEPAFSGETSTSENQFNTDSTSMDAYGAGVAGEPAGNDAGLAVVEDEDEELQRALNASLQSYEEDQLRQVMEDTGPKAWTQALPQASSRELQHTRDGYDPYGECQGVTKDASDVPPSLPLHAPRKHSRMPPSKKARYAWTRDSSEPLASVDPRSLEDSEAAEIWQVLFAQGADDGDVERWLRSSFVFVGTDGDRCPTRAMWACPWGLRQELGGPCGVLAAVQGFIVHALLWGAVEDHGDESLSQVSTTAGTESDAELLTSSSASSSPLPSPVRSPADGGAEVETTASPDSDGSAAAAALVSTLAERFEKADEQELLACALARILYAAAPTSRYVWAEVSSRYSVIRHEFASIQALAEWLVTSSALETSPCPVLSFVYSLVLTRGIEVLKRDMDDASAPLVGVFGHCAQELVNLCLTGRAVTNVFDGNITFEDDSDVLTLQGIQECPVVGFLSALEPLKLCEVGRFLKQPRFPLWVLGTSTHYSLFFSGDCCINHATTAEEEVAAQAFSCNVCSGAASSAVPADGVCATLLHFNGKDIGAERPELSALSVRTMGPQERPKSVSLLTGVDDSQLFAEVVRSRWPGAEVLYLPAGSSSQPASPPRLH